VILLSSLLPSYTHIIKPNLKYIYLSFDQNGELVIKSPKVTQKEIEKVLIKKAAWITKSRRRILEKKGKPLEFKGDEEIYFLGKNYPICYRQSSRKRASFHFDREQGFSLEYHSFDRDLFERLVNQFYKEKARQLVPEIVDQYAEQMQLYPSRISFRKARSRWGSCSSSNAISFNYLMMKMPLPVIQYIVVHELAHIKHKHHQKEFWELVGLHQADYKMQRDTLKSYM